MEIIDLKIFCDIVELKSFTQSAKKNFLSQSAVSQRVNRLNEYYNGKLFLNRKKLIISEHGKYIYEKYKDILKLYQSTEDIILDKKVRDVLSIGFSENSKAKFLCPDLLNTLHAGNYLPEIYVGPSQSVFEKVVFGLLDYGIVGSRPKESPEIQVREVYEEKIVLATGINNKNKDFDIKQAPLILDHRDSGLYQFMKKQLAANNIDVDNLNIKGYVGTSADKVDLLVGTDCYSFVGQDFVKNNNNVTLVESGINLSRYFYEVFLKEKALVADFISEAISRINKSVL